MNNLTDQEQAAGWKSLFDGKTTRGWRGWKQTLMPAEWQVRDGVLMLDKSAEPGDPGALGGGIVTEEEFSDFELVLEWKLAPGGNSGIFYRVAEDEVLPNRTGPEMQILDDELHPDAANGRERHAGACYQLYAPSANAVRPPGEWNQVRIVANRNHIQHWLNGTKLVEYELGSPEWLERLKKSKYIDYPRYGRLPSGHILLQDHGHHVEFRNIRIRRM
jgi:hypothetical protein